MQLLNVIVYYVCFSSNSSYGGGGGGGWEARTRHDILRVVLGPCVQYCHREKTGGETKI